MKHLYLASGLLIGAVLAGCGDYGDDGAVYSTGSDTAELGSTDFNLAVAFPTFDGFSGKLQRSGHVISQALTGNSPVEDLLQANVRAYVIVPDDSSIAGYREVPIEVVEFENLGSGRYRIAIDGQAQVDGFFAITIGGIEFRIPMSRTGTTDEPIDVNVLQAALADRLQSLLVANEVCDAVTTNQLNAVFDAGEAYMTALDVPSSINDAAALIEFYRVAVGGFIQSEITQLCAPALDSTAIAALAGDYHSLFSGAAALQSSLTDGQGVTLKVFSATTSQRPLSVDTAAGSASFGGSVEAGAEHAVSFVYDAENAVLAYAQSGVFQAAFDDVASLSAFANDPQRVQFNFAEQVDVYPDVELRTMLVERVAPATAYPHESSLFGTRSVAAAVFDLGNADSVCLDALGLTSAVLTDSAAFSSETAAVIASLGAEEVASRLAQSCGEPAERRYESFLDVDSQHASGVTLDDFTGSRFAFVALESSLLASDDGTQGGVDSHALDAVFDIDSEATLSHVAEAQAKAQLPTDAASPLSGAIINNSFLSQFQLSPAYDGQQQVLTNGQLNLQVTDVRQTTRTYSGFADASRNVLAFDLSSQTFESSPQPLGGAYFTDYRPTGLVGSNYITGLARVSGYIYAAAGVPGLAVFDATNPRDVSLVNTLNGLANAVDVVASGNRLYVTTSGGGLTVLDISSPAAPVVLGNLGSVVFASPGALASNGAGVVYVADGSTLRAIDVSAPALPVQLDSLVLSHNIVALSVAGNRVYASISNASTTHQLVVVDATTPASLSELGSLSLTDQSAALAVSGNRAYVGENFSGVRVIDISNPAAMTSLGTFGASLGGIGDIQVDGNVVYASFENDGSLLRAFDVTDPANAQTLLTIPVQGDTLMALDSGYLFGSDGFSTSISIFALDISQPSQASVVGTQALGSGLRAIQSAGNTAYVVDGGAFSVIDLTSRQSPAVLGTAVLSEVDATDMVLSGNFLYLSDGSYQQLRVFDVSNPSAPTEVGSAVAGNYPQGVDVSGSYVYVVDGSAGVSIYDVSMPASPEPVQTAALSNSAFANAVAVAGNFAYAATSYGLAVVDVTFPVNAAEVASLPLTTTANDVVILGNYAFVGASDGVRVIDISTPTAPVEVATAAYQSGRPIETLRLVGDRLYAVADFGIIVLDVTSPTAIQPVAAINNPSLGADVEIVNGDLVTGTTQPVSALQIYDIDPQATYSVNTAGLALGVRLPSTAPTTSDLIGRQFTLVGQQSGLSQASLANKVMAGVLGSGKLRFVGDATNGVYPVVDLPLEGIVSVSFDGAMPELALLFDQWTPSAVTIDTSGRIAFSLTSAGESATFAGYISTDGLLIGRTELLTADPAISPTVSELGSGSETFYPQLLRSLQCVVVGIPRS